MLQEEVEKQFVEAENVGYSLEEVFEYNYAEMPDDLRRQKEEYQQFYFGKEIGNECDDNGSGDQQRPGHQAC